MRTRSLAFALGLALALPACHPSEPATASSILPLRTLRLYETGVGYFERSGAVGADRTALPVPAGHLDDALKTLVILSKEGGARVHGVEFASSVSKGMARSLAGLPLEADAPITYADMLMSLKGAHVDVTLAHERVRGRIVDVLEDPADAKGDGKPAAADEGDAKAPHARELTVLLMTDDSELRRVRTSAITAVRPTDPAFAARLGSALDALSSRGAQTQRLLEVLGDGKHPVTLGYIAETPMWRTTYRLVLGDVGKGGRLQGWALLHNDTDEDWNGVHAELVNGRPDSFLFPLAAPRYARRELVHPENEASTVPQLAGQTVDAIWGDNIGDAYGAGGLGLTGKGEGGGGTGDGVGLGSIGTIGHGDGVGTGPGMSSVLNVGNLAQLAQASGVESGALFTYGLAEPLALRAHASALVPFVEQAVDCETITWVGANAAPRSAVRFVNNTAQTLPSGPISFFGDGGFAGESGLDRLKPGERRFLTFGADLDVVVKVDSTGDETPKRLVYTKSDMLEEHFLRATRFDYAIENRSGKPRSVYVVLPLTANATVTGADALDFDLAGGTPVAVFHVAARQKLGRTLAAVEGLSHAVALSDVAAARLTELAATSSLAAADRAVATEAAQRQGEFEQTRAGIQKTKAEVAEVTKDLDRLRENLKAMGGDKGAAPANHPFVTRIVAAEDRLTGLRKKEEALEADTVKRRAAVKAVLEKLARS
jgi:hypothetical protein